MGVRPVAKAATDKYEKRRYASMSQPRFKPTIPVFEQAKIFRALDSAATAMGGSETDTGKQLSCQHHSWQLTL
jgi:hypothetical protein